MPKSRSSETSEEEEAPRRPRRAATKNYAEAKDTLMALDSGNEDDDQSAEASDEEEEEPMEVDDDDDDSEQQPKKRKGRGNPTTKAARSSLEGGGPNASRRTSSRSTKFAGGMAEPPQSLTDLFDKKRDQIMSEDDSDNDEKPAAAARKQPRSRPTRGDRKKSPTKSPAKRHTQRRRSLAEELPEPSEASSSDEQEELKDDDDDDESDEEPLKIQRIIASRTETKKKWRVECERLITSEIHYGSRWFQESEGDELKEDGDSFEERFLVKWADLSFLHTSWETQNDLLEYVGEEKAKSKMYLTTFFRKAVNGFLFSQDERCDGDYFDPAWTQIDRILEIQLPEDCDDTSTALSVEREDALDAKSFGMIMDKKDPEFDNGTGRQFLIKWSNLPYSDSTYEFERDLIMNDIEYKEKVKDFLRRNRKPKKPERRAYLKKGEDEYKRLYSIFGDKSKLSESERDKAVEKYRVELQEHVYKNGGQLRDYQAEGVAWMIANFTNKRSCILADEMGLGKTLQTAAAARLLATQLNRGGPVLVVAPLSTLQHWHREFCLWTDLNAIVYHGTADDRRLIREHEFAYECDRPDSGSLGFNSLFLKKCLGKKSGKSVKQDSPWMVDVVVTTPEMMITDDANELAAVDWEVLVVDEAHRLKNFNSKLAVSLRNDRFTFRHKMLLTGTPIQNNVDEFWTLLNFIDPEGFDDSDDFMEKYGDMKSKESVDELHEEIRPYILRRLKEDVEHSVPPKEETLIEVELTVAQKQYYRALYEKNVKFLHKNKSRALDGPSLNNLAMQLRKCCNHLFLLNGVEDEFRQKQMDTKSEGDFLAKASGKLVLLDKLLPRLKAEGHRVLLFSQFKIMLDILEDYMDCREMKFERIDGSITGNKRQQAIDRFQTPSTADKEAPFLMMLSTRAGGVGINLTDTCIIFDSDWNPQNDLQAQARCHRIGQTKSVKIYRLLTRKTYEMQMFHMSSLKMGLDQAVLKGFEGGGASGGDGALSKEEVEKLLRHGAYDIFNEEKAGDGDAESNEFVQQDIDSILQRRSRTVVHDNTGSNSNAAGGTFSKASFKAKTPNGKNKGEDIDIDDANFWTKMIGATVEDEEEITSGRRKRATKNYAEHQYKADLEAALVMSGGSDDSDASDDDDSDDAEDDSYERWRWGGSQSSQWKKEDAETVIKALSTVGYDRLPWEEFVSRLELTKQYDLADVKRLCWTATLLTLVEVTKEDSEMMKKRTAKAAEKQKEERAEADPSPKSAEGGVLAVDRSFEKPATAADTNSNNGEKPNLEALYFAKHLKETSAWMGRVLSDAVAYATANTPREKEQLEKARRRGQGESKPPTQSEIASTFAASVWPSLKTRGWKAEFVSEGESAGKTHYSYDGRIHTSHLSVLKAALANHPELQNAIEPILASAESTKQESKEAKEKDKAKDVNLSIYNVDADAIRHILERYGSIQLICDRASNNRVRLPRRVLSAGTLLYTASKLVRRAGSSIEKLAGSIYLDKRTQLPHPRWTSYHDAVLINSIAKHGWIDHDASVRAIANDPDVHWGPPFDTSREAVAASPTEYDNANHILATAERAAACLNSNSSTFDELKDFNVHLVVRAYNLIRHHEELDDFGVAKLRQWDVDRAALQGGDDRKKAAEPVELPPKKDLVRRAKAILTKSVITSDAGKPAALEQPTYEYAELDQRDGANVFLAQLLRAILKEPSTSRHVKRLCSLVSEEARCRADLVSATAKFTSGDKLAKKTVDDLRRIADHMDEVKRGISKSATQCKNIVRVVLGEEPQKPRKEGEAIFPQKRVFSSMQMPAASSKVSKNKISGRASGTGKTTGEKAIDLARRRLLERYGAKAGSSPGTDLELTEIETLILSSACAVGLPVWTENWKRMLAGDPGSKLSITWEAFGNVVTGLADKSFERSKGKLMKARQDLQTAIVGDIAEAKGLAQASLENEQKCCRGKENVVTQAKDYASEPETLAKKTVMLVAKIRQHMNPVSITPQTAKSDSGLGPKVLNWLGKEITNWAGSLDLLDDYGRPLAFIAVEFIDEVPESERRCIDISSVLDKKGCRLLAGQVSLMTRIRSIFSLYEGDSLNLKISKVVNALKLAGDKWEKQPIGWTPNCDAALLMRLMECGMTDALLTSTSSLVDKSPSSVVPYSNVGYMLSKGALQLRANQLARGLHSSEESATSQRTLEERGSETGQQTDMNESHHRPEQIEDTEVEFISQTPAEQPVDYSDVEVISSPEKRKSNGKEPDDSQKKLRIS